MTSLLARGSRRNTSGQPEAGPDHVRTLLGVALRPTGVAIALICAAVLVTLVSSNSDLAGAVGAVAASWLAVHQVSLTVTGAPLGILPLLPTMLMMWVVARGCARAVAPDADARDVGKVIAAAVAGPIAATLIALAVITDAAALIPLQQPSALEALGSVFGIHLLAAAAGITATVGPSLCARWGLPDWVPAIGRPAGRAAGSMFAAGAAVTAASLVWSWSEVGDLLGGDFGFVGLLGSTVLSVLYLPNVAMGALAVLVGGTAHAGAAVSVFDVVPGPVPPVPVLAGVPTALVGSAWPILLIVPVTIGALLGRDCGRLRLPMAETAYVVASAAAVVGVVAGLFGLLAGGDLGSYGFVGVEPAALGVVTFGWLVVPGLVVGALLARGRETEHAETHEDQRETDVDTTDIGTGADDVAAPLEIRRLERPTVRYRSGPDPELEQATGAAADAPDDAAASDEHETDEHETGEHATAEDTAVVEAEIVEEPATPTVTDGPEAVTAVEVADVEEPEDEADDAPEATSADEAALPDGPGNPRD
ncbi:cell division protein PerM [Rhodococcus sp. SGAir0479]|uniref:cell division protein PerM n=1 Tax=Rhodococcus sp. SGAir0479 TaxID=2567884 RepID=UPI0010CD5CD1|nr:DUF6350 family protein [Rhodococcus sp. SGAir0479]QCQ90056.1 hypothetical protein E7742_01745 [Rhodococcus sp. SGAir0479]